MRKRPSDEAKSYPVDIAVFKDARKTEDKLILIVECKKKNRKEGAAQLKLYLDMSPADLGVWFNGDEHVYLRKIHKRDGSREYQELPNIPRFGQRIEDIGLFKRKALVRPPSGWTLAEWQACAEPELGVSALVARSWPRWRSASTSASG